MGDYASYQVTSIEDRKKLFSLIQATAAAAAAAAASVAAAISPAPLICSISRPSSARVSALLLPRRSCRRERLRHRWQLLPRPSLLLLLLLLLPWSHELSRHRQQHLLLHHSSRVPLLELQQQRSPATAGTNPASGCASGRGVCERARGVAQLSSDGCK